jgi:DMSO/TMAO reductase YedYZ heme-binding membrane subunit
MASLEHRKDRLLDPAALRTVVATLLLASFYACVRYLILGDVRPRNWPLYVNNKAVSLTALALLALSYLSGRAGRRNVGNAVSRNERGKALGLMGFTLMAAHALMSLLLLAPSYYPKFFDGDKLNVAGELGLLLGVVSFGCFTVPAIASLPRAPEALGADRWARAQRVGYWGLAAAALHVLALGLRGWLDPSSWPGCLPPITMISFLIAVTPLLARLVRNNR